MKNLPRTIGYVLPLIALGAGIVVFSCADKIHSTGAAGKVTIQQSGILIRPGTQLSEGDQTAMNEILKSYDKSLYKIQTYENGQLKKTQGKLSDIYIDKATASEAAKAMTEKGSTQYVIQIGFLDKTHVPSRRRCTLSPTKLTKAQRLYRGFPTKLIKARRRPRQLRPTKLTKCSNPLAQAKRQKTW